MQNMVT